MTPVAHQFESPRRILLSATSSYAVTHAATIAEQVLPREDMEERRWQLEWDRRNIED